MSLRREPFYEVPTYPDADPLVLGAQLKDIYLFLFCLMAGLVLLFLEQTFFGFGLWVVGYWVNKWWIKFKRAKLGDVTNIMFFRFGLFRFSRAYTKPSLIFISDTPVHRSGAEIEHE